MGTKVGFVTRSVNTINHREILKSTFKAIPPPEITVGAVDNSERNTSAEMVWPFSLFDKSSVP